MARKINIPLDPPVSGYLTATEGDWGILLAHGDKSAIETGILHELPYKLKRKGISTCSFNFKFRELGKREIDDVSILDETYSEVWKWIHEEIPDKKWILGGHDIGGETAIRVSSLVTMKDSSIPPVVCLNYPLYPPNRPEVVDAGSLGAVMGDILFCQAEKSSKGSFNRLKNQVEMMVAYAQLQQIRGANHDFEVEGKPLGLIAKWIANDIDRFIRNLY